MTHSSFLSCLFCSSVILRSESHATHDRTLLTDGSESLLSSYLTPIQTYHLFFFPYIPSLIFPSLYLFASFLSDISIIPVNIKNPCDTEGKLLQPLALHSVGTWLESQTCITVTPHSFIKGAGIA
jgi:hypothetical protein